MIDAATQEAWPQLMAKLRLFIARRVAAADIDDVLQDALLRIQRGVAALRDSQRFGPWVYQVTRSAIADHLRAKERAGGPADASDAEASESPDHARDAYQANDAYGTDDADELRSGLVRCLAVFVSELPSPYREAVTLTELEGLTQRAAADILGVSVSGMKSRVQRGRARLRARFADCCAMTQDARGRVVRCDPRPRQTMEPSPAACACRASDA